MTWGEVFALWEREQEREGVYGAGEGVYQGGGRKVVVVEHEARHRRCCALCVRMGEKFGGSVGG